MLGRSVGLAVLLLATLAMPADALPTCVPEACVSQETSHTGGECARGDTAGTVVKYYNATAGVDDARLYVVLTARCEGHEPEPGLGSERNIARLHIGAAVFDRSDYFEAFGGYGSNTFACTAGFETYVDRTVITDFREGFGTSRGCPKAIGDLPLLTDLLP